MTELSMKYSRGSEDKRAREVKFSTRLEVS